MHSPPDALDAADHGFPDTDAWAPLSLGFRVQASPKAALCLRVDFGDSSGVQVTIYNVSRGIAVTAYHQFRKGRGLSGEDQNTGAGRREADPRGSAGHPGAGRRPPATPRRLPG